jgi:alpha-beta hydrolase superfamily lysophospholipase
MSLAGQDGATDGNELVPPRPDRTRLPGPAGAAGMAPAAGAPAAAGPAAAGAEPAAGPGSTALFRRRSAHASRRGVLHLQGARDALAPPDLASWFTERGYHFYVAALRLPATAGLARRPGRKALARAFAELDARCEHLRTADGIDNVIVTAHGEGALAAARWCAAPSSGSRPDALILYAPSFGRGRRAARRGLDIPCPVLVIGGTARRRSRLRRRPAAPPAAIHLGSHVTWLRPADSEARPDAREPEDRRRFFDEMGRWLGAYMYGQVRDQLL